MILEDYSPNRKRASKHADIKTKCHSQPTLPVYPNSIEHFCRPELMSDQRYIHWGQLLPSLTHGLAINAVKLASGFYGENTAHEVDLGLSDGVQNGVLKWDKYLALNCDQAFFSPPKRTLDRRLTPSIYTQNNRLTGKTSEKATRNGCQSMKIVKTFSNLNSKLSCGDLKPILGDKEALLACWELMRWLKHKASLSGLVLIKL